MKCVCRTGWAGKHCTISKCYFVFFHYSIVGEMKMKRNMKISIQIHYPKVFSNASIYACYFSLIETEDCSQLPCDNGGTCTDGKFGGFKCKCAPGFTGKRCKYSKSAFTFIYPFFSRGL